MRLTGFEAIEFAEKESLPLRKMSDRWDDARENLTIAEAEAIATEDPELIYLDVSEDRYYGDRQNIEPER